jgi:hypothetical protein
LRPWRKSISPFLTIAFRPAILLLVEAVAARAGPAAE